MASKIQELCIKEGDQNIKFFHASTIIRRRINFIYALKLSSRTLSWDQNSIENEFVRHFVNCFKSSNPPPCDSLTNLFNLVIFKNHNKLVIHILFLDEIKVAFCDMHSLKACSLDSFQPLFYKQC